MRGSTQDTTDAHASRPVWLVGMMGVGKSTMGPLVARELARPFIDTDDAIVALAGKSVQEIFASEGEAGFRDRERAAIAEAAKQAAVTALGGGAIAQPGAPEQLASLGIVVYLRARPATLLERIGEGSHRPLLAGLSREGRLERLTALLEERAEAYESASVVVNVDNGAAAEVAREIAAEVLACEAVATAQAGEG